MHQLLNLALVAFVLLLGSYPVTALDTYTTIGADSSSNYVCLHDQIEELYPLPENAVSSLEYVSDVSSDGARGKRNQVLYANATWDYMRISFDMSNIQTDKQGSTPYACGQAGQQVTVSGGSKYTCTNEDILTEEKRAYLERMLVAAANKLSALRVMPVVTFKTAPGITSCASSVQIPQMYINGVTGTDFLLLVTARPIPPPPGSNGRTLATATTCQTDTLGRPIVGWANFNPSSLSPGNEQDEALQLGVAIHEISHALGFSYGTFSSNTRFKRWDGTQWVNIPSSAILEVMNPGDPNSPLGIKTPSVVQFAKQHFGCSTLTSVPLETGGGGGTARSHWHKQVLFNEYMTGTASADPVFSNITLSLFADMGWYLPDFSRAEPLGFGRNQGCVMLQANCKNWPSTGGYKCSMDLDKSCTPDFKSYGMCNTAGGLLLEGCGYYLSSTLCTFPYTPNASDPFQKTLNDLFSAGEEYGPDSRCFVSSLNRVEKVSELVPLPGISTQRCYRTACQGPKKLRIMVNGFHYLCPIEGGELSIAGFGGKVTCPPNMADSICQNLVADDPDWPILEDIIPQSGKPGDQITVIGQNFNKTSGMQIVIETYCDDVVVLNNTHMIAKLPPPKAFYNPRYLNIFGENKLPVAIRDVFGRSDVKDDFFNVVIEFNLQYLEVVAQWAADNPLWATLLVLCIVFPCMCLCYCCYRKCRKQKPKRGQYQHNYDNYDDQYYYDEDYSEAHSSKSRKRY